MEYMRIYYYSLKKATIWSPFYFYRFPNPEFHRAGRLAPFPLAAGLPP